MPAPYPIWLATEEQRALFDEIGTAFGAFDQALRKLPEGRYRSLALTAVEEGLLWGMRCLVVRDPDDDSPAS
jgi:hypothetical protein